MKYFYFSNNRKLLKFILIRFLQDTNNNINFLWGKDFKIILNNRLYIIIFSFLNPSQIQSISDFVQIFGKKSILHTISMRELMPTDTRAYVCIEIY